MSAAQEEVATIAPLDKRSPWSSAGIAAAGVYLLWAIILVCVVALFNLFQSATPRNASREIYFSDFMAAVERSEVGAGIDDGDVHRPAALGGRLDRGVDRRLGALQ